MSKAVEQLVGYEMTGPGTLGHVRRDLRPLEPEEVLIRVAGCGLCHTDIGFLYDGVRTRKAPPLILGHEISGVVEDAGSARRSRIGEAVVVPAVLPCGKCDLCASGRGNVCRAQVMPGNDCDGGFATRVVLPDRGICRVPGAGADPDAPLGATSGLTLRHLSVVADAVSTAYQAVERSGAGEGSLAIVIGLGGVGGYAAQLAAERGAAVVGLDVDARRLANASALGVAMALDPREVQGRELRERVISFSKSQGVPATGWTILECSGSAAGQLAAWGLLGPAATLMVVGFTLDAVEVRLSNLMAFDARALGNWGCRPELYPEILEKVLAGKIDVVSGTELVPLSRLHAAIEDVRHHRASRRLVLAPEEEPR
jgi:6-hydroxycyclohex-1-ene-1-carbonyl-CoA dehydrogenase